MRGKTSWAGDGEGFHLALNYFIFLSRCRLYAQYKKKSPIAKKMMPQTRVSFVLWEMRVWCLSDTWIMLKERSETLLERPAARRRSYYLSSRILSPSTTRSILPCRVLFKNGVFCDLDFMKSLVKVEVASVLKRVRLAV